MDEIEVVTIDDREYYVLQEVKKENKTFLFLSSTMDEDDTLIRKVENNQLVPLEDEQEFEVACNLLLGFFLGEED